MRLKQWLAVFLVVVMVNNNHGMGRTGAGGIRNARRGGRNAPDSCR